MSKNIFSNYEALKCDVCEKSFMGRKPAEGGEILCPECLESGAIPVTDLGDEIPDSVDEELQEAGGGEDE